ncbi:hypothetical protein COO60DRAFT_421135 [Scenedesmus sp. NREL 46B-D3]|nr:hypothetical protein COO60DRAFT_421135 [Scenedesmus sp. NREL 46B-D3]
MCCRTRTHAVGSAHAASSDMPAGLRRRTCHCHSTPSERPAACMRCCIGLLLDSKPDSPRATLRCAAVSAWSTLFATPRARLASCAAPVMRHDQATAHTGGSARCSTPSRAAQGAGTCCCQLTLAMPSTACRSRHITANKNRPTHTQPVLTSNEA